MTLPKAPDRQAATSARLRAAGCVYAEEEARLIVSQARTEGELDDLVQRRAMGLPLEQVLGWAEFCGARITVEPGVFVPRRRSELLVREATHLLRSLRPAEGPATHDPWPVVVDLCCGSGAVGAALVRALPRLELVAVDIDPVAVRCARRNLSGADHARAYVGDLYDPLPSGLRGRVDVVVANAPYVPSDAIRLMPPEARVHEPRAALDGGADGVDVQRRVVAGSPGWLAPGGRVLVETTEQQIPLTIEAFVAAGLVPRVATSAELDAVVVIGSRPAAAAPEGDRGERRIGAGTQTI